MKYIILCILPVSVALFLTSCACGRTKIIDGEKYHPKVGYEWVNPNDPEDHELRPMEKSAANSVRKTGQGLVAGLGFTLNATNYVAEGLLRGVAQSANDGSMQAALQSLPGAPRSSSSGSNQATASYTPVSAQHTIEEPTFNAPTISTPVSSEAQRKAREKKAKKEAADRRVREIMSRYNN